MFLKNCFKLNPVQIIFISYGAEAAGGNNNFLYIVKRLWPNPTSTLVEIPHKFT